MKILVFLILSYGACSVIKQVFIVSLGTGWFKKHKAPYLHVTVMMAMILIKRASNTSVNHSVRDRKAEV